MGLKLSKSSDHDDALSTSTSLLHSPAVQDSHFVLELVRNADENVYPCDVEPTVTFIVQETRVIVLNNDQGFSVESIKALCDDVFCSKKDPSSTSGNKYIGKKGVAAFNSVFWFTNALEIHSNDFHIMLSNTNGLPKWIPPRDISLFCKMVAAALDSCDPMDDKRWNTCMVLPKKNEELAQVYLTLMFPKLHPCVMLFLHRLECIKYINFVHNSLIVMRKEVVGDGFVNIFQEEEKTTWFVKKSKLQVDDQVSSDHHVQTTTEISIAFMLKGLNDGNYTPEIYENLVFASLLPLISFGLKFIIQADFIVSSSRKEEVEVDNPWNQWLLNELPNVFVNAEISFCSLPCFKENPAKGVSVFLSFVPLEEDQVEGFFSCLTHTIISKLRVSNCLLLEEGDDDNVWVRPCKVVRNWTEETRSLLPDSLIREHLNVGYLNKDTVLSDSLAQALSIEECGPIFLVDFMASLLCGGVGSLKSMGLSWLSSWLNVLYHQILLVNQPEYDMIICSLSQLPFIPLLDGSYASISEGVIWILKNEHGFRTFGIINPKLRIVNPALFSDHVENITQMLYKLGVQRLAAHDTLTMHVLPALCSKNIIMAEGKELMIEYLSFVMVHLESGCSKCLVEKEQILSRLSKDAYVSTNYGYVRFADVAIHFGKEFGNPIDMSKLLDGSTMKWVEIDIAYLKHPVHNSLSKALSKWRNFLMKLGVTDFVKIVKSKKSDDWDSQELIHLLSHVSSNGDKQKGVCLLKVLDTVWDVYFSDKPYKGYVIKILSGVRWLASSMDDQLHFPKDLFHNCENVLEILGNTAPYTVPKISNMKLLNDIGLKNTVTLDDALAVLRVWRRSKITLRASIYQMSKFYTYLLNRMSISKKKISKELCSQPFIFVPWVFISNTNEMVCGLLLSPSEVCWDDSTGLMEQTKSNHPRFYQYNKTNRLFSMMLSNIYPPGLHDFFVKEFGVAENPPLLSYLEPLLQLSNGSLPSLASKTVFQVFRKWSDELDSGIMRCDDIDYVKKSMKDKKMRVLPTSHNEWVSLHKSFGLIFWCEYEQLTKEFINLKNVNILHFWELTTGEKQMLRDKVSVLFSRLGIPSLSENVNREVVHDGPTDSSYIISLVNWALPYAQRYIYNIHPNEYYQLKLSGFKTLHSLKITVVDKLFYTYVINKFGIKSNNLTECTCLLHDNVLYAARKFDDHSLFIELSRLLLVGIPEFNFTNFLHVITTMAKSGFTEVKMEEFVTNSQNLPNLPSEESQWSLSSTSSSEAGSSMTRKTGKMSSWPPVHWKMGPVLIPHDVGLLDSISDPDMLDTVIDMNVYSSDTPQNVITGRIGESEAFKYFCTELGEKRVTWVNEVNESGLPYDILVEDKDNNEKEYIEVKSTSKMNKDWFNISLKEWAFAVKKGESFSIARVVLSDKKPAKITTFKNPAKLCRSKQLQLAIHPNK
ncbi:protein NO VEIN-like [Rutidosis leptorrhynchoides]|uniref:protein NO VEIN-like n=1 Tax=Rutidosis leptorrhynchoides TaxID=125765 RepID=UPI003A9974B5